MCSNLGMRWSGQALAAEQPAALPGLVQVQNLVRSVTTPEFAGVRFHEVLAKSALNKVPGMSAMPFSWTVNPYRGCSHACVYCFARRTHEYLDLDAGRDFDSEIIVKVNVAEVLRREVAKSTWRHPLVALGTNTDPYQRAEGRYRLMPGVIEALAESGTPMSILTKGTLLRRDLPLLQRAAELVPVELALSIAVYDDRLQQQVDPGTPSTRARLETVRAVREAGFDCTVFLMPVLPYLTDSVEHLEKAVSDAADAGATRLLYSALHLRPGAREWYLEWIAREHPALLQRYRGMYAHDSYAPQGYRRLLATRMAPLLRRYGMDGSEEDDRPTRSRPARAERVVAAGPPTLF